MRHTQSFDHSGREAIAVDEQVPRGFAHVAYEIGGFNTAHNPLVKPVNGFRPIMTRLPIVFESGTRRTPDGVTVENVLAVCEDHLNTKRTTMQGTETHARAAALIREAVQMLEAERGYHEDEQTQGAVF